MKRTRSEFLNVDLDLKSPVDLGPLVHAFGRRVLVLHVDRIGRRHWVRLTLARQPRTPSEAIRGFVTLVAGLPAQGRAVWARADKEFDIGVQGGFEPRSAEWVLEPKIVQALARLGAQVRLTVYSPPLDVRRRTPRT